MKIIGTGSALPIKRVTNDDLASFLDTSDEWISSRTGIRSRHILTDETLSELGGAAALMALENAGLTARDIDMILCSTVLGDTITPGLGCGIQSAIGANCPTADINCACAGFLYALDMADAYIASGKAKTVLVVCAEGTSRFCDWTDRSSCVLFGDGAAAVVATEGENMLLSSRLTTKANMEVLYARPNPGNNPYSVGVEAMPLTMDGQEVYKFAVSSAPEDLRWVIAEAKLEIDQIDHFLIHQANKRIVDSVRARLKVDPDKFPLNIDHTGNTSSASVPILMDELNRSGRLKKGDLIAMSAFGAGLTTGACVLRWAI